MFHRFFKKLIPTLVILVTIAGVFGMPEVGFAACNNLSGTITFSGNNTASVSISAATLTTTSDFGSGFGAPSVSHDNGAYAASTADYTANGTAMFFANLGNITLSTTAGTHSVTLRITGLTCGDVSWGDNYTVAAATAEASTPALSPNYPGGSTAGPVIRPTLDLSSVALVRGNKGAGSNIARFTFPKQVNPCGLAQTISGSSAGSLGSGVSGGTVNSGGGAAGGTGGEGAFFRGGAGGDATSAQKSGCPEAPKCSDPGSPERIEHDASLAAAKVQLATYQGLLASIDAQIADAEKNISKEKVIVTEKQSQYDDLQIKVNTMQVQLALAIASHDLVNLRTRDRNTDKAREILERAFLQAGVPAKDAGALISGFGKIQFPSKSQSLSKRVKSGNEGVALKAQGDAYTVLQDANLNLNEDATRPLIEQLQTVWQGTPAFDFSQPSAGQDPVKNAKNVSKAAAQAAIVARKEADLAAANATMYGATQKDKEAAVGAKQVADNAEKNAKKAAEAAEAAVAKVALAEAAAAANAPGPAPSSGAAARKDATEKNYKDYITAINKSLLPAEEELLKLFNEIEKTKDYIKSLGDWIAEMQATAFGYALAISDLEFYIEIDGGRPCVVVRSAVVKASDKKAPDGVQHPTTQAQLPPAPEQPAGEAGGRAAGGPLGCSLSPDAISVIKAEMDVRINEARKEVHSFQSRVGALGEIVAAPYQPKIGEYSGSFQGESSGELACQRNVSALKVANANLDRARTNAAGKDKGFAALQSKVGDIRAAMDNIRTGKAGYTLGGKSVTVSSNQKDAVLATLGAELAPLQARYDQAKMVFDAKYLSQDLVAAVSAAQSARDQVCGPLEAQYKKDFDAFNSKPNQLKIQQKAFFEGQIKVLTSYIGQLEFLKASNCPVGGIPSKPAGSGAPSEGGVVIMPLEGETDTEVLSVGGVGPLISAGPIQVGNAIIQNAPCLEAAEQVKDKINAQAIVLLNAVNKGLNQKGEAGQFVSLPPSPLLTVNGPKMSNLILAANNFIAAFNAKRPIDRTAAEVVAIGNALTEITNLLGSGIVFADARGVAGLNCPQVNVETFSSGKVYQPGLTAFERGEIWAKPVQVIQGSDVRKNNILRCKDLKSGSLSQLVTLCEQSPKGSRQLILNADPSSKHEEIGYAAQIVKTVYVNVKTGEIANLDKKVPPNADFVAVDVPFTCSFYNREGQLSSGQKVSGSTRSFSLQEKELEKANSGTPPAGITAEQKRTALETLVEQCSLLPVQNQGGTTAAQGAAGGGGAGAPPTAGGPAGTGAASGAASTGAVDVKQAIEKACAGRTTGTTARVDVRYEYNDKTGVKILAFGNDKEFGSDKLAKGVASVKIDCSKKPPTVTVAASQEVAKIINSSLVAPSGTAPQTGAPGTGAQQTGSQGTPSPSGSGATGVGTGGTQSQGAAPSKAAVDECNRLASNIKGAEERLKKFKQQKNSQTPQQSEDQQIDVIINNSQNELDKFKTQYIDKKCGDVLGVGLGGNQYSLVVGQNQSQFNVETLSGNVVYQPGLNLYQQGGVLLAPAAPDEGLSPVLNQSQEQYLKDDLATIQKIKNLLPELENEFRNLASRSALPSGILPSPFWSFEWLSGTALMDDLGTAIEAAGGIIDGVLYEQSVPGGPAYSGPGSGQYGGLGQTSGKTTVVSEKKISVADASAVIKNENKKLQDALGALKRMLAAFGNDSSKKSASWLSIELYLDDKLRANNQFAQGQLGVVIAPASGVAGGLTVAVGAGVGQVSPTQAGAAVGGGVIGAGVGFSFVPPSFYSPPDLTVAVPQTGAGISPLVTVGGRTSESLGLGVDVSAPTAAITQPLSAEEQVAAGQIAPTVYTGLANSVSAILGGVGSAAIGALSNVFSPQVITGIIFADVAAFDSVAKIVADTTTALQRKNCEEIGKAVNDKIVQLNGLFALALDLEINLKTAKAQRDNLAAARKAREDDLSAVETSRRALLESPRGQSAELNRLGVEISRLNGEISSIDAQIVPFSSQLKELDDVYAQIGKMRKQVDDLMQQNHRCADVFAGPKPKPKIDFAGIFKRNEDKLLAYVNCDEKGTVEALMQSIKSEVLGIIKSQLIALLDGQIGTNPKYAATRPVADTGKDTKELSTAELFDRATSLNPDKDALDILIKRATWNKSVAGTPGENSVVFEATVRAMVNFYQNVNGSYLRPGGANLSTMLAQAKREAIDETLGSVIGVAKNFGMSDPAGDLLKQVDAAVPHVAAINVMVGSADGFISALEAEFAKLRKEICAKKPVAVGIKDKNGEKVQKGLTDKFNDKLNDVTVAINNAAGVPPEARKTFIGVTEAIKSFEDRVSAAVDGKPIEDTKKTCADLQAQLFNIENEIESFSRDRVKKRDLAELEAEITYQYNEAMQAGRENDVSVLVNIRSLESRRDAVRNSIGRADNSQSQSQLDGLIGGRLKILEYKKKLQCDPRAFIASVNPSDILAIMNGDDSAFHAKKLVFVDRSAMLEPFVVAGGQPFRDAVVNAIDEVVKRTLVPKGLSPEETCKTVRGAVVPIFQKLIQDRIYNFVDGGGRKISPTVAVKLLKVFDFALVKFRSDCTITLRAVLDEALASFGVEGRAVLDVIIKSLGWSQVVDSGDSLIALVQNEILPFVNNGATTILDASNAIVGPIRQFIADLGAVIKVFESDDPTVVNVNDKICVDIAAAKTALKNEVFGFVPGRTYTPEEAAAQVTSVNEKLKQLEASADWKKLIDWETRLHCSDRNRVTVTNAQDKNLIPTVPPLPPPPFGVPTESQQQAQKKLCSDIVDELASVTAQIKDLYDTTAAPTESAVALAEKGNIASRYSTLRRLLSWRQVLMQRVGDLGCNLGDPDVFSNELKKQAVVCEDIDAKLQANRSRQKQILKSFWGRFYSPIELSKLRVEEVGLRAQSRDYRCDLWLFAKRVLEKGPATAVASIPAPVVGTTQPVATGVVGGGSGTGVRVVSARCDTLERELNVKLLERENILKDYKNVVRVILVERESVEVKYGHKNPKLLNIARNIDEATAKIESLKNILRSLAFENSPDAKLLQGQVDHLVNKENEALSQITGVFQHYHIALSPDDVARLAANNGFEKEILSYGVLLDDEWKKVSPLSDRFAALKERDAKQIKEFINPLMAKRRVEWDAANGAEVDVVRRDIASTQALLSGRQQAFDLLLKASKAAYDSNMKALDGRQEELDAAKNAKLAQVNSDIFKLGTTIDDSRCLR